MFTALTVEKMMRPAHRTQPTLPSSQPGRSARVSADAGVDLGEHHDQRGDEERHAEGDPALLLPQHAAVVGPAHLEEVVEEPERGHGRDAAHDEQGVVGEVGAPPEVGHEVADRAATRMAMPPMVGVPALCWCSGPRSSGPRMGWPLPRLRKNPIRKRVDSSDTTAATALAMRSAITGRPPAARGPRPGRRRDASSPATVWVVSWPLPAITTTSPGPASASARAMAARRSASYDDARRGDRDAGHDRRDDGVGSSWRGLSEVTTTRSAPSAADRAHERALLGVTVAAAAEDHDDPARRHLPQLGQQAGQRIRRVGEVDHHPEGLAGLDRLHAARAPARPRPRPAAMRPSSIPSAAAAVAAARALATLNRPPRGSVTSCPRHRNGCRSARP